jgi:hypothetical protein
LSIHSGIIAARRGGQLHPTHGLGP